MKALWIRQAGLCDGAVVKRTLGMFHGFRLIFVHSGEDAREVFGDDRLVPGVGLEGELCDRCGGRFSARRGLGIGLGALGVAALAPFVVGGLTGLVTGPRSKFGVRRRIQRIRDFGIVAPDYGSVEDELREQGLL